MQRSTGPPPRRPRVPAAAARAHRLSGGVGVAGRRLVTRVTPAVVAATCRGVRSCRLRASPCRVFHLQTRGSARVQVPPQRFALRRGLGRSRGVHVGVHRRKAVRNQAELARPARSAHAGRRLAVLLAAVSVGTERPAVVEVAEEVGALVQLLYGSANHRPRLLQRAGTAEWRGPVVATPGRA